MIEKWLTNAWQHNRPLSALTPLSRLYGVISQHKKDAYLTGKKDRYYADVPVLVIGNITVGGSGKTPLIIELVRHLQKNGIKVGVISRGYGGHAPMPSLVTQDSLPSQVGDEPCLIVQKTHAPTAVAPERKLAIELLLSNYKLDMILCDDGLQHYALYRDDEWIVVDVQRGFGNGKLLPQGFLREPIERLANSTVIYHGLPNQLPKSPKFQAIYSTTTTQATMILVPQNPKNYHDYLTGTAHQTLTHKKVCAVTGIGYPKRFFKTLGSLGFEVIGYAFNDHHDFKVSDFDVFKDLDLKESAIIVTEKDMIKIKHLNLDNDITNRLWVLPVDAKLSDMVYQKLDAFVQKFVKQPPR